MKVTYNLHVNHKRIQRLMGELGIKATIRKNDLIMGKKKLL
ncbi:IS3 family transposase [Bacillus cereus]